jgi:hypothetical protein
MESYIIPETCVICSNNTIICPLSYKCGHKFCMSCIYLNRTNEILKSCPICRTYESICNIKSPIYNLSENVNYVDFYSHFLRNPLKINESVEFEILIGKHIVLHISQYIIDKNRFEDISYIGVCYRIHRIDDYISVNLNNCYYLDRTTRQIYPTTPTDICILIYGLAVIIYTEE